MLAEMNTTEEPRAFAVLLHPHPDFGGNRFHPFIDGLFRRLPESAVAALRFDFSSADLSVAQEEVLAAIDEGSTRWPQLPVVLAGYSFGAGVAAGMADERIAGWYLLAPPGVMLSAAPIGHDPRPKGDRRPGIRPVLSSGRHRRRGARMGEDHGHDGAERRPFLGCRGASGGRRPAVDRRHGSWRIALRPRRVAARWACVGMDLPQSVARARKAGTGL